MVATHDKVGKFRREDTWSFKLKKRRKKDDDQKEKDGELKPTDLAWYGSEKREKEWRKLLKINGKEVEAYATAGDEFAKWISALDASLTSETNRHSGQESVDALDKTVIQGFPTEWLIEPAIKTEVESLAFNDQPLEWLLDITDALKAQLSTRESAPCWQDEVKTTQELAPTKG